MIALFSFTQGGKFFYFKFFFNCSQFCFFVFFEVSYVRNASPEYPIGTIGGEFLDIICEYMCFFTCCIANCFRFFRCLSKTYFVFLSPFRPLSTWCHWFVLAKLLSLPESLLFLSILCPPPRHISMQIGLFRTRQDCRRSTRSVCLPVLVDCCLLPFYYFSFFHSKDFKFVNLKC